ncbi:hypothetical protein ACP70R_004068 [Stipagrostis hirtigluma subsp. patula]
MAARWAQIVGLLLLLPLVPSTSSATLVFKLDGSVYPAGHFYVTMNIGDPAKPYFLDIDTGSNLTWLECDAGSGSCKTCNKVPHPLYKPTPKNIVPCVHRLCTALHQDLGSNKVCTKQDQCDYEIRYLDGSSSLGVFLIDKLTIPMRNGPNAGPTIAFGCGYDQGGHSSKPAVPVDGILGLGRGSVDIVSLLKDQKIIATNVIGHCLSTKGGGYLLIGVDNVPSSGITWVPMAPRTPGKLNHYSPGPATLLMATKPIGKMEVILDSGSTYTYLPDSVHKQLVSELKASIGKSLEEVTDPALELCWKGAGPFRSVEDLKKEFKLVMSLKFDNGASMIIPPENCLIITGKGNACLGMLSKEIDMYLIGDITVQDQLVIYDNEKGQLGWMRSTCHRVAKSTFPIFSRI